MRYRKYFFTGIIVLHIVLFLYYFTLSEETKRYYKNSFSYLLKQFVMREKTLVAQSQYADLCFAFIPQDAIGRKIYKYGVYEEEITSYVINKISWQPKDVILDIGANLGWYAIILDRYTPQGVRIYAFEPDPQNFSLLQENIVMNHAHKVVPVQKAVSDQYGVQDLYLYGEKNLRRHSLLPRENGLTVSVETIRLDDFDDFKDSDHQIIRLMKIDIEGYETQALSGAISLLDHTENIILEYSPDLMREHQIAPEIMLQILNSRNFRPYLFGKEKLTPITKEELLQFQGVHNVLWKKEDPLET